MNPALTRAGFFFGRPANPRGDQGSTKLLASADFAMAIRWSICAGAIAPAAARAHGPATNGAIFIARPANPQKAFRPPSDWRDAPCHTPCGQASSPADTAAIHRHFRQRCRASARLISPACAADSSGRRGARLRVRIHPPFIGGCECTPPFWRPHFSTDSCGRDWIRFIAL